jgi:sarcosine oxidase/sarcosine oxidase subunit beta
MTEVAARFPMIRRDGLMAAVETEGGMLFPVRILTDLTVALAERGVALIAETRVSAVDPEAGVVVADGREHRADHVVVAAGAWVDRLTDRVSAAVTPSRQAVIYLAAPTRFAAAWRAAPALIDLGAHGVTYTLPPRCGTRLKVGDHLFTRSGDPDDDRAATEADVRRLLLAAGGVLEDFGQYRVLERKACYYTVTRDDSEQFQVKPWGAKGWVISACSGHGFKLGPLISDGVAAAIAGEVAAEDVTRWAAGQVAPQESGAA